MLDPSKSEKESFHNVARRKIKVRMPKRRRSSKGNVKEMIQLLHHQ